MRIILTADLHLTDRPKDSRRLGILPWLNQQKREHKADLIAILGDITDHKDKHSAKLVNAMADGFAKMEPPVVVLMGNHDYIDPDNPYFEFLNWFTTDKVFIKHPAVYFNSLFIPHVRTQQEFDYAISEYDGRYDFIFAHQTFDGVISETGQRLTGFNTEGIAKLRPRYGAYSGDIHRPQRTGPIMYVGAPYSIRFGDNYEPRVLMLDGPKVTELHFDAPRKWSLTVREPDDILRNKALLAHDQVKLTIEMVREEANNWKALKSNVLSACREKELEVFGVSFKVNAATTKAKTIETKSKAPRDIVEAFSVSEKLPSATKAAGVELCSVSRT